MTGTDDGQGSNCLGIHGWNNISKGPGTTLSLSFQNGDPCFVGTISAASAGWGAVYNLTFANSDGGGATWDADAQGVTGFDYVYTGSTKPDSLKVIYKGLGSSADFCKVIAPGDVSVPFADTTNCGNGSGAALDTAHLYNLILAFPVGSQSYPVDFCVQISARD
jgi:hypothetical protein